MSGDPFNTSNNFDPTQPPQGNFGGQQNQAPQNQGQGDPWNGQQNQQAPQLNQGNFNQQGQGDPWNGQQNQQAPQQNQGNFNQQGQGDPWNGQQNQQAPQNQGNYGSQQQAPQQNQGNYNSPQQAPQRAPQAPMHFSADVFKKPSGNQLRGNINKEDGELLLMRPTNYEEGVQGKFGLQNRITLDYVVVTGPKAGRVIEHSFNSNGFLRNELRGAWQQGKVVLARVVHDNNIRMKDGTSAAGWVFNTEVTDQERQMAYAAGIHAGFFEKDPSNPPQVNWTPVYDPAADLAAQQQQAQQGQGNFGGQQAPQQNFGGQQAPQQNFGGPQGGFPQGNAPQQNQNLGNPPF